MVEWATTGWWSCMREHRRKQGRTAVMWVLSALVLLDTLVILVDGIYIALRALDVPSRQGITEGIVANLMTTLAFTVIGVIGFVWFSVIERRRLFHFFGVKPAALGIRIYVSCLEVLPGGTRGTQPIATGYVGPAMVQKEYESALLLRRLFQPTVLALIPDTLRDLLAALFVSLSKVEPGIEVAPAWRDNGHTFDADVSDNVIAIGGPIYNSVSRHYLDGQTFYYFEQKGNQRVIRKRSAGGADLEQLGRASGHELACIQRLKDRATGATIFIFAGLGSGATYGSVQYLVDNWNALQRQYRDRDFGLCLSYETTDRDAYPTVRPRVIDRIDRISAK